MLYNLTLKEKIGLVSGVDWWHSFGISRLNVPAIRFTDGPNGARGTRFIDQVPSACLPCGSALGATFDKELLYRAGQLLAAECKAKGASVLLAPTVNIQRAPVGGRGYESFSEDPVVTGLAASSVINGLQDSKVQACIKHFVCNDMEHERNSMSSDVPPRALREIYLMPFQIAIRDSNPGAIMTAYNSVNGVHVSNSHFLLDTILRKEWNWEGMTLSDWYGTYSLKKSIEAGLDLEMPGAPRFRQTTPLAHLIMANELDEANLDDRVRNVLKLVSKASKAKLPEHSPEKSNDTPETREFLRELCHDGIVLLKNDRCSLPLSMTESIAVIGPNAKVAYFCGGGANIIRPYHYVDPYQGISTKLGYQPEYTLGCYNYRNLPGLGTQLLNPRASRPGFTADFFLEPAGNEPRTRIDSFDLEDSHIKLFDYYNPLAPEHLYYIDIEGEFIPDEDGEYEFGLSVHGTALLFIDGKLLIDNKTRQFPTLDTFNVGTREERRLISLKKGQSYLVRIEFGSVPTYTLEQNEFSFGGGGRISFGAAKVVNEDLSIKEAVDLASTVDKAILCIGLTPEWECEGGDRTNMALPGRTDQLVSAVLEANPNTVVVNQSGSPVEMPWISKASTVVQMWYGGNELGNALADILFGDVNPSAKLPMTFPQRLEDNPAYLTFRVDRGHCYYGEGVFVGYKYYEKVKRDVLFPFGHGLSYTCFRLENMVCNSDNDKVFVSLDVQNCGKSNGAEVIQVYITQNVQTVQRPPKQLADFTKVFLSVGEKKVVSLSFPLKYAVSFFDEMQNMWCAEEGTYTILVGTSSHGNFLKRDFKVSETFYWNGI